jgi:hypothetical protein
MVLAYSLTFIERTIRLPNAVTTAYPSRDSLFGSITRNLANSGRGLDSAREVALVDLRSSLKAVFKDKKWKLPLGDNHALGVEYVEEELRKLRNAAQRKWGVPEEFKELSLRRSLEEVISVLERYPRAVTFAKPRQSPAFGYIETSADFPRMRAYLERLRQDGLDPRQFLLPPRDVSDEEVARRGSGGSVLADKFYSDEATMTALARFYDLYQLAYRWIVENLFPLLRDQLYFYRVGPVKFKVLIFRNLYDEPGFGEGGKPSLVFPSWEPVASLAQAATVCEVTYEWSYDQGYDALDYAP